MLAEWRPLAGQWIFEREKHAAGRDVDGIRRDTREERRHDVTCVDTCRHHVSEKGRLSCEPIECRELEAGKATLIELLVGKFVEQNPYDPMTGFQSRSNLLLVKSGCGVQVTSLPAAPDKLGEDDEAGKCEKSENGRSGALDCFEARKKFSPKDHDRHECEQTKGGHEICKPVGDFNAREVSDRVEEVRWDREEKGGPDDDAQGARAFGEVKESSEKEGKGNKIGDDGDDDGGGRTNKMVDEVVFGRDERACEIKQIEVGQTEGYSDGMGERPHRLLFFRTG